MKAVVATERPRSASILGVKKDSNCSIMKTASIDFRGEKFSVSDEMKVGTFLSDVLFMTDTKM